MSEEERLITEPMVKKATQLIHKLANQKNETFETIRSKCKKMFGYTNLAKLSFEDGHAMISKLIDLTRGEEEARLATDDDLIPQQGAIDTDDLAQEKTDLNQKHKEKDITEGLVTSTMREAVRDAVDITIKEVVEKDVPVQGLGGFVLEIAKVIFDAKMQDEAV
jgi:hypothetical protein